MYTSKQFADLIEISVTTLINWERVNILVPARKTPTGRRFYTDEQYWAYVNQDYKNPILTGLPREE